MIKIDFDFDIVELAKFALVWGVIFAVISGLGYITFNVISSILQPFAIIVCIMFCLKFIAERITIRKS